MKKALAIIAALSITGSALGQQIVDNIINKPATIQQWQAKARVKPAPEKTIAELMGDRNVYFMVSQVPDCPSGSRIAGQLANMVQAIAPKGTKSSVLRVPHCDECVAEDLSRPQAKGLLNRAVIDPQNSLAKQFGLEISGQVIALAKTEKGVQAFVMKDWSYKGQSKFLLDLVSVGVIDGKTVNAYLKTQRNARTGLGCYLNFDG